MNKSLCQTKLETSSHSKLCYSHTHDICDIWPHLNFRTASTITFSITPNLTTVIMYYSPVLSSNEVNLLRYSTSKDFLWPPYGIGQPYIFALWFLLSSSSIFFSSPNLSRRRLDVCHTCTHGVALVQI